MALSQHVLRDNLHNKGKKVPLMAHYVGTLRADDTRLSSAPLNTDSHRRIEYLAPINHRREKAGKVDWFVGQPMLDFMGSYLAKEVLSVDSYLLNNDPAWHEIFKAGYLLQLSSAVKNQKQGNHKKVIRAYESTLKKAAEALNRPVK